MKRTLLLLTVCGSLVLLFQNNRSGALPQNTGAPGDLTCGRAPCHNVTPNTGDAEIAVDFDMGNSTYSPGERYTVTISISNTNRVRHGFQILALDEQNQNAGTWELTDEAVMQIRDGIDDATRKYVTHRTAGTEQESWSLDWIAPAETVGTVTFYSAVLDANNNGSNSGDNVYTTSTSVQADAVSNAPTLLAANAVKVFPNLATDRIFVRSTNHQIERLNLYNQKGQLVRHTNQQELHVSDLPAGYYILHAMSTDGIAVQKILVQR